ncbi:hypothetical protein TNCV_4276641 [Trichonephila clavipes]|nr:hypothetical protein TNCV_4276641 [Trichonephila clavipes]
MFVFAVDAMGMFVHLFKDVSEGVNRGQRVSESSGTLIRNREGYWVPVVPETGCNKNTGLFDKTPTETYSMLVCVYESVEWFACFREGRESVFDNTRRERLVASASNETLKVRKLITKGRRLTVRMIAGR